MLKILKLKVEQSVVFSGASAGGAEQASAQQRASSGAQRPRGTARGRVRPRGMARGCARRLRGGPSAGHRARRRRRSARRGQCAGRRRRVGNRKGQERERNLGFEKDPRAVVVCTNLKQQKVMKKKSFGKYTSHGRLQIGLIVAQLRAPQASDCARPSSARRRCRPNLKASRPVP